MKNYFKKFGIMFVMSLILMLGLCVSAFATDNGVVGISNLNNTVNNSAKVGDGLKLPEIGWKRYDDTDSRILYSLGAIEVTPTAHIAYLNTKHALGGSSPIKISFMGTKLRLLGTIDKDCSGFSDNIQVKVDGNLYNYSIKTLPLVRTAILFQINNLDLKTHYVEITNLRSNMAFDIDAIDIDDTGNLLDPNESISLDKTSMTLTVGEIQQLTATTTPASVGVTWTSSDSSIATIEVDQTNGKLIKVNALKEGTCTITATTNDGSNLSASCIVTVTPKAIEPIPNPTPTPTPNPDLEYIVNTAHAKGDNTNNASGGVSIIYMGLAEAQLSVVKTADVSAVYVGDNFTYTIVVTNSSSKPAKAVVVKDSAPNHIQFIVSGITTTQGNVDSSSTSSNVVVNVGDIPALGTVTIKIPATVIL